MGGHTLGPWTVEEDDSLSGWRFIPIHGRYEEGERAICEVQPIVTEGGIPVIDGATRANAALIAAAPCLLEALKLLLADIDTRGLNVDPAYRNTAVDAVSKAEARDA